MSDVAKRVVGMEKQAAIDFIHGKGLTVRIAMEDGFDNHLQGGYSSGRINITVVNGKVTEASEG